MDPTNRGPEEYGDASDERDPEAHSRDERDPDEPGKFIDGLPEWSGDLRESDAYVGGGVELYAGGYVSGLPDPVVPYDQSYDQGETGAEYLPERVPRAFGQVAAAPVRTVKVVTGDYLLTVNPVDGSEIELCPPGERPEPPAKHTADEREDLRRAAAPPVPAGPALPRLPLLERQEERERLVRLVARGRSVRLTGPSGSGRTALLDAVADDCADLAPDGVVRLSGYRRTATDLLYDLFATVHRAAPHRPGPDRLRESVQGVGAVVIVDDLEFGGASLDELLDATPECAFVLATTPDVPSPSTAARLEEVFLGGLDRAGSLELLERTVGRVLTEDEANWAGDLWFESEGLPLRFVQAGALLRQGDALRTDPDAFDPYDPFGDSPRDTPYEAPYDPEDGPDVPLPTLAEGVAPVALLASRLSDSARAALRFAVALGGEVPHQAHLPALVGDTHADAALAELAAVALVTPVGARFRLAAGVLTQLESAGYADDADEQARAAARHYAWWAGHPSVTPRRVCAEADAVLAALAATVTVAAVEPDPDHPDEADRPDEPTLPVHLARTAAPAFAAGSDWNAWERALRSGQEAARISGEVGDEAYFLHELGVLALCGDQLDRARAELEASIALRGALADKRGTVAGRRALALVADRSGDTPPGTDVPDTRYGAKALPTGGVPAPLALTSGSRTDEPATLISAGPGAGSGKAAGARNAVLSGARRNLVAVGAGALLAAVLGTVVTLGATSDKSETPAEKVGTNPSATQGADDTGTGGDEPAGDGKGGGGDGASDAPTDPGADGVPGTSDDPSPSDSVTPSAGDSDAPSGKPSDKPSDKPSSKPPTSKPPTSKPPTSKPPTSKPPTTSPDPTPTESDSGEPTPPGVSDSASGPAESSSFSDPAGTPSSGGTEGSMTI
ncbi:ATP-binding protein [Streptomyces sp. NPDC058001]|uniref:ATP-binding protein n=1 Tax=Streptomyces sp. NPDC058001 TaxID=3346300 RepID=UPI0036EF4154